MLIHAKFPVPIAAILAQSVTITDLGIERRQNVLEGSSKPALFIIPLFSM